MFRSIIMCNFRLSLKLMVGIFILSVMLVVRPSYAASDVLILNTTTSPQTENAVVANGLTYDIVDAATWGAMTTADFAEYKAIVLSDPRCGSISAVTPAIANAPVWGEAVTGPVIVLGTDEVYHSKNLVSEGAVAFAASSTEGKTGAYISLGCYYHGTPPLTPVPLLDSLVPGGFTVTNVPGCFDSAHIVATHPALFGITDAYLSGWGCSVHEAFDTWPVSFEVLAIATTGGVYTAPDGSVGTPYILARGVTVISDIDLDPDTATNPVGSNHTVTATVAEDGVPVIGVNVDFEIVAGANVGLTGSDVTNSLGEATFTYSSAIATIDTIQATFVDSLGRTQRSDRVTKEWIGIPPIVCDAGSNFSVNEATPFSLDASLSSGGSGTLSFSWTQPLPLDDPYSATPSGLSDVVDGNQDHVFVLTVSDDAGQSESCNITLTVIDSDLPPDCSNANPTEFSLWPPNHKLHEIGITGVVDPEGGSSIQITDVFQDEPVNGLGDGDTSPDVAIDGDTARVRAQRSGTENGRVYTINFTATDALGQTCEGVTYVGVPHDKKDTPVNDGALFDSTVE